MAKLNWDATGERFYGVGVDRGVFYPPVGPGLAWDGLISVTEVPSEAKTTVLYFDGAKYRNELTLDTFAATIEAYSYPLDLENYDGGLDKWGAQPLKPFNFSYRTYLASDTLGVNRGYQIHLVYNALAKTSEESYSSIDDSAEASIFTWDLTTKPEHIPGMRPSAHLIIDTTKAHAWTVTAFEEMLYGTATKDPHFPTIEEVIEVFEANAIVRIIDHGDGTWTAIGPDAYVHLLDATSFEINWPSAIYVDTDEYQVRSL